MRYLLVFCLVGCGEDAGPDVPTAKLGTLESPLSGDVALSFVVSDQQSSLVNVEITYGHGPGPTSLATPAQSSPGSTGLQTSPDGTPHTFVWDSVTDLGYGIEEDIYLAISLHSDVAGIGDEIGPHTVDNSGEDPHWDFSGTIRAASTLLPTSCPPPVMAGTLWVGLYYPSEVCRNTRACTPVAEVDPQNLGSVNFDDDPTPVPFSFLQVPEGLYFVVAVLDHNNSAPLVPFDRMDVVNSQLDINLNQNISDHQVVLDYGFCGI